MARLSTATPAIEGTAILIIAAMIAAPAAADRHCAPALDLYYQARHEILVAPEACPAGLSRTALQLEEAAVAARNCGCAILEGRLHTLLDRIRIEHDNGGRSCQARAALVLDAAGPLDDAYDDCL
ncbi:MAG: hypothetical protein OEN55_10115 [Alphaproteobacteria bacterium]|nr:hypothetical protein [Alphaproteobacteria bacterium]